MEVNAGGDGEGADAQADEGTRIPGEGGRSASAVALGTFVVVVVAVVVFAFAGGAPLVTGAIATAHGALDPVPQVMTDVIGAIPTTATAVAPVAATTPVTISLELALPSSAALTAYENGLATPGAASYHHYLSLEQFYQTYGPLPASVTSLLQFLRSTGLTVAPTSGPWIYTVSGTAAQMNAAFSAPLYQYQASPGVLKYAPKGLPSLPAGLAPLVGSLYGLNQFDLAKPSLLQPTTTTAGATTPSVMRGFYNSASLISGGDTGSSYAIGLAEMCDPSEPTSTYTSDLATFDSDYSLPSTTVHYIGSGASSCSGGSQGWGVETDLDMQWAHAMAPGAVLYVCLDDSNPATCDQTFVNDHTTDNIEFGSNSWGGGTADHSVWASAMSAGMTLLASAGDSCEQVNYPAAEPDGLGVGGTSITPSGTSFGSETVWSCSGGSGTGGGCDSSDAPPSYQVGMTGYPGACSSSQRGVPDVAMDADPNTGVDIVTGGSVAQYGGTSLACPMWAASLDLIYQGSGATGFAGPTIYSLAKSANYPTLYHDITSGSNGLAATAGWDPDTGVGSPNIGALEAAWTGGTTSPLGVSVAASPQTGTAPLAVAFTGTVSGGVAPYTYAWNFGDGGTSTSLSPSHTYTAAGTYTAKLTATDSTGASAWASLTITVSASSGPLTATASATPTSGTAPLAVAFTGSASGGTAPYTYGWAFGDGSTSTSQNPSHTYSSSGTFTATLTVTATGGATATSSVSITVSASPPPLSASASASPTTGTAPLAVAFTGSASGGTAPYTYSWAFGDGSTSAVQDPSHTYTSAGSYTSTLTVTATGGATATASVAITVSASSSSCTSATALSIGTQVTGSVAAGGCHLYSAAISQSQWDAWYYLNAYETDGAVTGSQPVFQVYSQMSPTLPTPSNAMQTQPGPNAAMAIYLGTNSANVYGGWGTYLLLVQASASGSGSYCLEVALSNSAAGTSPSCSVGGSPLTATASAAPTSGTAPLTVAFTGSASGGTAPYSYSWAFGDGSTSTSQSPSHTYTAAGSYTSTLTVKDSSSHTATASVGVTVSPATNPLSATASGTPPSGTVPLAVAFTGGASGGTSPYTFSWAFGDGSTSTSQSPSHTYTAAGTYSATLTVKDSAGHTASSSVSITASAAASGGCGGITYNINVSQVKGCSLNAGAQTVIQFKISQTQWDAYYYLNVWESDGTVASGSHFSIGAGMGGTPSLGSAQQTANSPNAKFQIYLGTQAANLYGGWGTYWVVVESVGGAGGFCFEAALTNYAQGSGPSCSQPEVSTFGTASALPSLGAGVPPHDDLPPAVRGATAPAPILALTTALFLVLLAAALLASLGALLSRKGDERSPQSPTWPEPYFPRRSTATSPSPPKGLSYARSGAKKQGEGEDRDHGGQR